MSIYVFKSVLRRKTQRTFSASASTSASNGVGITIGENQVSQPLPETVDEHEEMGMVKKRKKNETQKRKLKRLINNPDLPQSESLPGPVLHLTPMDYLQLVTRTRPFP
ncbi:hypothetical protein FEM48_Zijuj04G0177200 [Ziziphus jujuba var. spinosa]|uniref:Uncharacterized protein n=1 Tax=Ziziphus jujuba var. spinosa TaxID=714518 RepID=A0A978VL97_ZIZJJ|nr:hypothetical protein FEM48_Zijuj04G0177200 [Ziziphus jujuba var. spinosa]